MIRGMPVDDRIHLNITISGRVQGVGFRFAASNMAVSLGITGIIKNDINGDVYIEAEGDRNQLRNFVDWCFRGPSYADVEDVNTIEANVVNYKYFDIIR